jgi:flavorubredoxin
MPVTLYNRDGHECLMFTDLSDEHFGEAVQSNQFLITDDNTGAIIDPGGNLAYSELFLEMSKHFAPQRLSAILASHADPDIIASLDRWMTSTTHTKLYVSKLWERFVPHFCKPGKTIGRVIGIPDAGMRIRIGRTDVLALPAHFMHAEGNFQFYDPVSRILFSGDLGVSMLNGEASKKPVTSIAPLLRADMVSSLTIDMIVPQHGAPMTGGAVKEFIQWVRQLQCGVDLMEGSNYRVPS